MSSKWERHFPFTYRIFMMIAEPRVVRLLHFGIYLCMIVAGASVLFSPPKSFEALVGYGLVFVFGGFIFIGAVLAAIAILPGIWWLERAGIISLITGLSIYCVLILSLGASFISLVIPISFILKYILRWYNIRKYQLAPLER